MQERESPQITFGPVPSRRLGRSLGINNIPAKHCSYSCLYCQVGSTADQEDVPRSFYRPNEIQHSVAQRVEAVRLSGEQIDYLTLVPDGEPTLDVNLAETIKALRPLGIKIAVISNASLIWREDVRARLSDADWVSLKVDTANEAVWRKINRPHEHLDLERILNGVRVFAQDFDGVLATETMLLAGINDDRVSVEGVADLLAEVTPDKSYLAVPTRPPAEPYVRAPDKTALFGAYNILKSKGVNVEYLIEDEGNSFALAGSVEAELLAITAVQPMRREAIDTLLAKADTGWSVVDALESEGKLKRISYKGRDFYIRGFPDKTDVMD